MAIICYIMCYMIESVFDVGISRMIRSRTTITECYLTSEAFIDCTFDNASYTSIDLHFKYNYANEAQTSLNLKKSHCE